MPQSAKTSGTVTRDPDRTRRRILTAALAEFSAKGFAGARVDAIARRARGNKRMIYHYYGNKEALFSAVLRYKMAERRSWSDAMSNDPAERLPFWFKAACEDADWVRLLEWEALQGDGKEAIDEKERREASSEWLERVRQRQKEGQMTPDFEAVYMALAMQSLTVFPAAFPQLVRHITGRSVNDPKFQHDYRKFLQEFAEAFKIRKRKAKRSRP